MHSCFVIMPFGSYFDGYYSEVIKPVVSQLSLVVRRADEVYSTNAILNDIYTSISNSDLCIADVTNRNPNVSYELGMAHALGKPVIIITQNIKDVPFDYRHFRIIEYDPKTIGWQSHFALSIENTIKEIIKSPNEHAPFKSLDTRESKMRAQLINIFYTVDCLLDKQDIIHVDERGSAKVSTIWTIDAQSNIYHMCENRAVGSPGKIEILRAYDKLNGRPMEIVEIERSPIHLSYLMILSNFKKPGQRFVLETEMYLENYLDGLAKSGEVSMVHQAASKSNIKYKRLIEKYHLPKLLKYKDSYAEYVNHPDQSLIGTRVLAKEEEGSYMIEVRYEQAEPFRHEVGVIIRDGSAA